MQIRSRHLVLAFGSLLALSAAGCGREESRTEKMGEAIGEAAEDIGEAAGEAAEEIEEGAEEAMEEVEEALE